MPIRNHSHKHTSYFARMLLEIAVNIIMNVNVNYCNLGQSKNSFSACNGPIQPSTSYDTYIVVTYSVTKFRTCDVYTDVLA